MRKEKFLEKVLTARVYDVARETQLDFMPRMSQRLGNNTYIKREDLQPVFSFKCRGAFNKIYQELQRNPGLTGVITASAGNHAQGVALAAKKLHLKAIVVMPTTTPDIKVTAVRAYGAKVVICPTAMHDEEFLTLICVCKQDTFHQFTRRTFSDSLQQIALPMRQCLGIGFERQGTVARWFVLVHLVGDFLCERGAMLA